MKEVLLGAIVGDYMGSYLEFANNKYYNFRVSPSLCEVTDDSILTAAIADALLRDRDYSASLVEWAGHFPNPMGGYGASFQQWVASGGKAPYNSYGNGAAMRISPVGWFFDTIEQTLEEARKATEVTHNHSEGLRGAYAVAAAIYKLRNGCSRHAVRQYIESNYYDLSFSLHRLRPLYSFSESCMDTVPVALKCYLDSKNWEDAVRLAVSMGGDADTLGAITGSIAIADPTYEIPSILSRQVIRKMPSLISSVVLEFNRRVMKSSARYGLR